jgi:ribosome maturation factor RimP
MRKDLQTLWNLVEPCVTDAGFDLVEVQSGREPSGWVVRLFIDRPAPAAAADSASDGTSGAAVSLADCERVSRDVSASLDVADALTHAYQLEVSSPGLDRPLRRERDFARFAGEQVRVRMTEGVDGRRNFSGRLCGAHDGLAQIDCDGRIHHLPIGDIAKANIVPDWDKELKRSAS